MQHITKAATVTATTDRGEFTAIAAAYTVDRVGDRIVHGAFGKTIAHWQTSGKRVPLHWDHRGEASNVIGSVDPATMEEIEGVGLKVSGTVDVKDSDVAREAWRSMKNGAMSLSFGYLVPDGMEKKGKDGANELHEIDLFEVSIVPAPANPDTRILSMKSAEAADQMLEMLQEVKAQVDKLGQDVEDLKGSKAEVTGKETKSRPVDPLRQQAEKTALDIASGGLDQLPHRQEPAPEPAPDLVDLGELKQKSRDLMLQVLSGVDEP